MAIVRLFWGERLARLRWGRMTTVGTLVGLKNHMRRRLLIGLVVFMPFAITIWVVYKILAFLVRLLSAPKSYFSNILELISRSPEGVEQRYEIGRASCRERV